MRALAALVVVCALAAAPVRASASAEDVARREFERATSLYAQGRYDDALDAYARAYALTDAPELLFNIGQCHAALGEQQAAIRAYRRYLDEAGPRADRALAEQRIAEARAARDGRVAWAPRPPAGGDDDGARTFVDEWWFWAGVAGTAVLVTATVAGGTWIAQGR